MGPTNDDVLPAVITAIRPGRIHIEKVNGPFVFEFKGSPAEYGSGLKLAIERGWLTLDRSGTLGEVHPGRRGSVRVMEINASLGAVATISRKPHRSAHLCAR